MKKIAILLILSVFLSLFISSCSQLDSEVLQEDIAEEIEDIENIVEEVSGEIEEQIEEQIEAHEDDFIDGVEVEEVEETLEETSEEEAPADTEETSEIEENLGEEEIEEIDLTELDGVTYIVEFVDDGFEPEDLTISVGDTVVWTNSRENYQAMLLGTRSYTNIKSSMLNYGDSYIYTFDEAGEYIFVDAILTSYVNTITVE